VFWPVGVEPYHEHRRSTPCRRRYLTTAEHVAVLVVSSPPFDTSRFRTIRRVRQLLIGDAAVATSGRWLLPGAVRYQNAVHDSSASASHGFSSDRRWSLHSLRGAGVLSPARRSAELAISRQEHGHARCWNTVDSLASRMLCTLPPLLLLCCARLLVLSVSPLLL